MNARLVHAALILLMALAATALGAQEADDGGAAGQANNPLADVTAVNLQNYFIGDRSEIDDGDRTGGDDIANQFWLRFAKPFGKWFTRASLPVNTFPNPPASPPLPASADDGHTTGLGDLNIFAAYLIDVGNPAVSFGVGPQLTAPSATDEALGTEKWSAGLANILFNAKSAKLQWGYLLTWQASFAGEEDRADVNVAALQPLFFYQLGNGTYLRSSAVIAYDFESDGYTIPLGLGIGQVIPTKNVVYNAFMEPQFSVADDGAGWPEWQVFVGFNMQF